MGFVAALVLRYGQIIKTKFKDTIMQNDLKKKYQALHAAAIALGNKMLATLPDEQLDAMERMAQSGAKLIFEIELPNCKSIALVLKEVEGKTWPVCKLEQKP